MQIITDAIDFKPPRSGQWGTPVMLALVAHALLMAALTWGVHWKQDEPPVAFEAEIWSALQLLHDLPLSSWSGRGLATAVDARSAVAYLPDVDAGAEAVVRAWAQTNAERAQTLYAWTPERVRAWAPGAQVAPIPESLRLRFGR